MKVTFMEKIESRIALSRKMYCPKCGSHCYCIHHQLQPEDGECWWIECEECGTKGVDSPSRKMAIKRWKQL